MTAFSQIFNNPVILKYRWECFIGDDMRNVFAQIRIFAPSGCARRLGRVISHRSADVAEGSLQDAPVPNTTPGFTKWPRSSGLG